MVSKLVPGPSSNMCCFMTVFLICVSYLEALAEKIYSFCRTYPYGHNIRALEVFELQASSIDATFDKSVGHCTKYIVRFTDSTLKQTEKHLYVCYSYLEIYIHGQHVIYSTMNILLLEVICFYENY